MDLIYDLSYLLCLPLLSNLPGTHTTTTQTHMESIVHISPTHHWWSASPLHALTPKGAMAHAIRTQQVGTHSGNHAGPSLTSQQVRFLNIY